MKKKRIVVPIAVLSLLAFTFISSIDINKSKRVQYNLPKVDAMATVTMGIQEFEIIYTPSVSNSFIGFREALAFKESSGKYQKVNTLGYLGKYQFGKSTLHRLKIYNTNDFLKNPKLQEEAFIALCSLNKWILKRDIKRSVGSTINGIKITESGILAAAHLAGAGNVKIYLRSNGSKVFVDAYGSDVEYYMRLFSGYNTSIIKPIKNATI